MLGWGVLKTVAIAIRHFVATYVDDLRHGFRKRYRPEALEARQGPEGRGVFTYQYPHERRKLPERSRNLPFLVIDAETEKLRCTACGVCAAACPVQCIWIERAQDPDTGRPVQFPAAYHLDLGLCMGCGLCAEFCPFDAIKMDCDYEVAQFARPGFVAAEVLAKPEAYHARIHPAAYAVESAKRKA